MASLSDGLVKELLEGRYIATVATQNADGSLHMVAVWFWSDGSDIFIATSSRSRKARNVQGSKKVSLMIDSRDPAASFGATIIGSAQIVTGESSRQLNATVHRKYLSQAALADPRVGPVFAEWDDITVKITPESVITWDMRVIDKQVLRGAFSENPKYLMPVQR
jgi:general stress protein 26